MQVEIKEFWSKVLNKIKGSIENENFYDSHVKDLEISHHINNSFYVVVNSDFVLQALNDSYLDKFNEIASNITGVNSRVYFMPEAAVKKIKEKGYSKKKEEQNFPNLLRKNMIFSNFIVGPSNEDAFNATKLLAAKQRRWNPLFLYGSTGLGKTHLANALGNEYLKTFPDDKISYISCDDFTREVMIALNSNKIEKFKETFKTCDLLIIEDVQFFMGREKTNEVFFNIFNSLIESNKLILMTSDKAPSELHDFEGRMISRFASGLVIEIKQPNSKTMLDIIKLKFQELGAPFKISDKALEKVVLMFGNIDIRKIEGIINRIYFFAVTKYNNLSLLDSEQIDEILESEHKLINKEINKDPSVILEKVCLNYNASKEDVLSESRTAETSIVRKVCMYIFKNKLHMSLAEIARFFNRNHSTVKTAIESAEKIMDADPSLKNYIDSVVTK